MKKILCVILALTFCLSILTSCGEKDTSGKSFAMAVSTLPNTFDPQIAETSTEKMVALNCFDTLFRPNENGELQCLAAESYTVSSNGLTYTIKIRKGQKYFLTSKAKAFIEEKGGVIPTEVTAKDFAFGITRAILPETKASDYILLSSIKNAEKVHSGEKGKNSLGVKVKDDYTLEIELQKADANFLFALSQPISAPCNEQFFDLTAGRYGLEQKYTAFTGGFYVSYTGNENSIKISKNSEYSEAQKIVPESVTFYVNTDLQSVANKVKKGNYDCGFVDSSSAQSLPNSVAKADLTNITYSIIFNLSQEKFESVNMRKGLVSAIDFSALGAEGATGIVAPHYRLLGKEISNKDVSRVKCDVNSARKNLKDAFEELDVSTINVNIACTEETEGIAKKIISSWQKNIGVELNGTLSVLTKDEFLSAIAKKEFDMAIYPVLLDTSNALQLMAIFQSENKDNFIKYTSEEYDRIFEDLTEKPTAKNLSYAQSFLIENAIVTPLYFDSQYFATAEGVSGLYYVADTSNVYFGNGRK